MFLSAILKQVDIQRIAMMTQRKEEQQAAVRECMRSIPSPNVIGASILGNMNLMESEDMELLLNETQEWEDVEF